MRRVFFIAIACCLLPTASFSQERYQVGQVEVRMYEKPKDLWNDLPEDTRNAYEVLGPQIILRGFTDDKNPAHVIIYSVKDWCVLLHEFKHFVEPGWRHPPFDDRGACGSFRIK